MKIQNYIIIILMFTLLGCNEVKDVPDYSILEQDPSELDIPATTEMTGEPVNIGLTGQIEMCEREPESVLCKDDD
jgi:hypothetical protein